MKFLNTSKELDAAEKKILDIYDERVLGSGSLKSVEKYRRWREAVKEMRAVLVRRDCITPLQITNSHSTNTGVCEGDSE